MSDKVHTVLQDCIEMVRQGASPEECLARYPEYAQELEPLLETALTAQRQLPTAMPSMPSALRTRVRARVMAEWDRRHRPRQRFWHPPYLVPRWAASALSVVLVFVLSGTGTVLAAGSSVPGDPLYAVKELREDVSLWFARSPEAKVDIYTRLVKQRAEELMELAVDGKAGSASSVAARLEEHVSGVNRLVKERIERQTDGPLGPDSELLEKLHEVDRTQQSAAGILQEMLEQAPVESRVGLQRALETIERARDRVGTALEALGQPVSPLPPSNQ